MGKNIYFQIDIKKQGPKNGLEGREMGENEEKAN
jgi:hypothetical protein